MSLLIFLNCLMGKASKNSFPKNITGPFLILFKFFIQKTLFDTISCVAPIGIFLGRIANFVNGELYGTPTQKPWGVIFPNVDSSPRHPSQIYEALLEGVLLFLILNVLIFFKRSYPGLISSLFLIFYGFFRIICEQFREPDSHIGYILNYFTLGSILSIAMVLFGFLFLSKVLHNEKNR